MAVFAILLALPVGWLVFAGLAAQSEIESLALRAAQLEIENATYRSTASELTVQITSLRAAMQRLDARFTVDPDIRQSIQQLPDITQARLPLGSLYKNQDSTSPFNLLDTLLASLDNTLQLVRQGVAYREALVNATPIIWPADGWISGRYGYRPDPFTGERDFHPAIDISTRKGQPVYATATGRILSASRNGDYGNLVEIDHGFGLSTRYGHLSNFEVTPGETVLRGQVIGYVGSTGRATGSHVHYEVWSGDRTINPLRLLTQPRPENTN